jgi:hypothetical protein
MKINTLFYERNGHFWAEVLPDNTLCAIGGMYPIYVDEKHGDLEAGALHIGQVSNRYRAHNKEICELISFINTTTIREIIKENAESNWIKTSTDKTYNKTYKNGIILLETEKIIVAGHFSYYYGYRQCDYPNRIGDCTFSAWHKRLTTIVTEMEIEDLGVYHQQYFQGVASLGYDEAIVGIGVNYSSAIEDALEQIETHAVIPDKTLCKALKIPKKDFFIVDFDNLYKCDGCFNFYDDLECDNCEIHHYASARINTRKCFCAPSYENCLLSNCSCQCHYKDNNKAQKIWSNETEEGLF